VLILKSVEAKPWPGLYHGIQPQWGNLMTDNIIA